MRYYTSQKHGREGGTNALDTRLPLFDRRRSGDFRGGMLLQSEGRSVVYLFTVDRYQSHSQFAVEVDKHIGCVNRSVVSQDRLKCGEARLRYDDRNSFPSSIIVDLRGI